MTTYRITHTDGTTESIHETFAHAIHRLRRKYDALVMSTRDGGDVTPDSDPSPGTEILVWTSEEDAQDDDGARAVASVFVGVSKDAPYYGISDEDGTALTQGVQGYDRARRMAQEFADERGGAVSLYADGMSGVETVEPKEYAGADDADVESTALHQAETWNG